MSKINSEVVKDFFANGGKALLNLAAERYGQHIDEITEQAFAEAIETGIENTVATLYEASVDDDDIISLLNKHWGIGRDEAISRLLFEKNKAPVRELRTYLELQGLSSEDIRRFMMSNKVSRKIKESAELRELRRNPAKLYKAVKEVE